MKYVFTKLAKLSYFNLIWPILVFSAVAVGFSFLMEMTDWRIIKIWSLIGIVIFGAMSLVLPIIQILERLYD